MTIGEKIKFARILRGMTQKELGFLTGLTDDRVRHYELNRRTPKEKQLKAFSDALGVPMCYFTDNKIDTYNNIAHVLLEFGKNLGAKVTKTDSGQYLLAFNDHTINQFLSEWYEHEMRYENSDDNEKEAAKRIYDLWQIRYPDSQAEEMREKIKAARKDGSES